MAGGWTQTPNFIYDLMPDMKEAEMKVVMAVVRKTVGWQCERVKLRMADLRELTGLSHPSVNTGIKAAMDRGILQREVDGESFIYWLVEPEASAVNVKNFNSETGNEGQVLDPESKKFEQSAVKNFNSETVKNLNTNKRNINTNKPKESEREPSPTPPTLIPSGVVGAKSLRISSPHLDARHFVNGFVPPGTGTSAVEVYYERFNINLDEHRLSKPHEDDLITHCKDLGLLREVITAYHQSTYRPRNIKLILDWYRNPSRFRKEHHGANNGRPQANYERPPSAEFTQAEWDTFLADPNRKSSPF